MAVLLAALVLRLGLVAISLTWSPWTLSSDVGFYHEVAQRSELGQYPYFHFWMEYPPLFPFLLVGLYLFLKTTGLPGPGPFYLGVATLVSLADLLNLLLVHRLARAAHGERRAGYATLLYAGLPFLVWYSLGWFDALAVLALLGGLAALLCGRAATSGGLVALGALTKLFPATLLLAAPLMLGRSQVMRFSLALGATTLAVVGPLTLAPRDLIVASAASLVFRQPWETIWALAVGNYTWGVVPPIEQRLTAETAYPPAASVIGLLAMIVQFTLAGFALRAAVAVARSGRPDPRQVYVLVALGVTGLLLGSKGFSPQFITWLVPLILLVWPNAVGLVYVLALGLCVMLAYAPLYQAVGLPTQMTILVILRTAALAVLFVQLFHLVQRSVREASARQTGTARSARAVS